MNITAVDARIRETPQEEHILGLYTLLTYGIVPKFGSLLRTRIKLPVFHHGTSSEVSVEKARLVKKYCRVLKYLEGRLIFDPLSPTYKSIGCPVCKGLLQSGPGGTWACRDCLSTLPKISFVK